MFGVRIDLEILSWLCEVIDWVDKRNCSERVIFEFFVQDIGIVSRCRLHEIRRSSPVSFEAHR